MNRSSPNMMIRKPNNNNNDNNASAPRIPFLRKAASTSHRWLPRLRPHQRLDAAVTHDPPTSGRRTKETVSTTTKPAKGTTTIQSSLPQASPLTRAKVVSVQPARTALQHSPNCVTAMPVAIAEPLYQDLRIPILFGDCMDDEEEEKKDASLCTPDQQQEQRQRQRQDGSTLSKLSQDLVTIKLTAHNEFESILLEDLLEEALKPMEEITVVFNAEIDFCDSDLEEEEYTEYTEDDDNDDDETDASSRTSRTSQEDEADDERDDADDDDSSFDVFDNLPGKHHDGRHHNYDDHYSFVLSDYSHNSIPDSL